jgi:hypothetical protein
MGALRAATQKNKSLFLPAVMHDPTFLSHQSDCLRVSATVIVAIWRASSSSVTMVVCRFSLMKMKTRMLSYNGSSSVSQMSETKKE